MRPATRCCFPRARFETRGLAGGRPRSAHGRLVRRDLVRPNRTSGGAPRAGQRLPAASLRGLRPGRPGSFVRRRGLHGGPGARESPARHCPGRRLLSGPRSNVPHDPQSPRGRLGAMRPPDGLQPAALRVAPVDGGLERVPHRFRRCARGSLGPEHRERRSSAHGVARPCDVSTAARFAAARCDRPGASPRADPAVGTSLVLPGFPARTTAPRSSFRLTCSPCSRAATSARWSRTRRTWRSSLRDQALSAGPDLRRRQLRPDGRRGMPQAYRSRLRHRARRGTRRLDGVPAKHPHGARLFERRAPEWLARPGRHVADKPRRERGAHRPRTRHRPARGKPLPTAVFAPAGAAGAQELPARESYPSLPTPVTMSGKAKTTGQVAVDAEVVFSAIDITDRAGQRFPPNFEFVARTTTDPRTGAYSVLLPQGDYRIAVRPTDASNAVTVTTRSVGGQGNLMTEQTLYVEPLVPVIGQATVADGRSLAEATVEVVPIACAPSVQSPAGLESSDACMPRDVQVTSAADGSFALAGRSWAILAPCPPRRGVAAPLGESIAHGRDCSRDRPGRHIPAPFNLGMRLTDVADSQGEGGPRHQRHRPRLHRSLAGGPPWSSDGPITDVNGNFEMYIAPRRSSPAPGSGMLAPPRSREAGRPGDETHPMQNEARINLLARVARSAPPPAASAEPARTGFDSRRWRLHRTAPGPRATRRSRPASTPSPSRSSRPSSRAPSSSPARTASSTTRSDAPSSASSSRRAARP